MPVAVAAHGADPIGAGQACVAYLTLRLSNGAIAHVHVNWLSPTKVRTTMIGGSRRTLVWDDLEPVQPADRSTTAASTGCTADNGRRRTSRRQTLVSYRTRRHRLPALPEREALHSVMAEFADAIAEGRAPLTDGRSGLRVLAMLEAAASRSAEHGTAVRIPVEAHPGWRKPSDGMRR